MLLSCPEHWAKVLLVLNDNEINSNDPLQVGDKHPALLKDEVEDDDNDATADDDDGDDDNGNGNDDNNNADDNNDDNDNDNDNNDYDNIDDNDNDDSLLINSLPLAGLIWVVGKEIGNFRPWGTV